MENILHRGGRSAPGSATGRQRALQFPTVGGIARLWGVDIHKVEYLIRARGLKPIGKAGIACVYSAEDVERIGEELRRIAQGRRATHE